MAKAASPIRLQHSLMVAARNSGQIEHRSATEQVEYWADLGRKISKVMRAVDLIRIQAGLAKITLEEITPAPVDSKSVFSRLDSLRDSGELTDSISSACVRYQASSSQLGLLDQVHEDGRVLTGSFVGGEFKIG